jgi:hypothetical protein
MILCSLALFAGCVGFSAPVLAADPFENVDCNKAKGSAICQDRGQKDNPLTGKDGLLVKAAGILAILGGIIAVIMMVYAGFTYVTSGGESQKVTEAKNIIIYSSVGLVVIVFGRGIVIFILNRL